EPTSLSTMPLPPVVPTAAVNGCPSDIEQNVGNWIATNGDIIFFDRFKVVAEIWPDPSVYALMQNTSLRGFVGAGEKTLIGGIIVRGMANADVVVRGIGPSLSAFGVQAPIMNPMIEVHNVSGDVMYGNQGWANDPRAAELASRFPGLVPSDPRECAILA